MTDTKKQQQETIPSESAPLPSWANKVPPQALDIEQTVLGALLTDRDAFGLLAGTLNKEAFYLPKNQVIFEAISEMYEKTEPVDILSVTEKIRKNGKINTIQNGVYLLELVNRVASSANIEHHSRILLEKYLLREMISITQKVQADAYADADPFEVMGRIEKSLGEMLNRTVSRSVERAGNAGMALLRELEKRSKSTTLPGVPSGLKMLDAITSGWQPSDLIVFAGRPGMGKTAFVVTAAMNAVKNGDAVALFSLEMSKAQIMTRIVSAETEINSERFKKADFSEPEWQKIQGAVEYINTLPLFIDDTPALSLPEFSAKLRRLKNSENIKLAVVDYLQLMTAGSGKNFMNRDIEIGHITRGLKALSKELDIPIIALCQLSRAVETRGGAKRPQLSDLRESGNIEQDCDVIGFLYRSEYYGITEDENGNDLKGIAEIIIAKHRNGRLDTAKVGYKAEYTQFHDLDTWSIPVTEVNHSPSELKAFLTGKEVPF